MKNQLFAFTILCLLSIQGYAQNTLNLSMKAGALSGKPRITSIEDKYDSAKKTRDGGSSFAMAFSLPIKNRFRIGTEFGFNLFNPTVEGTLTYGGTIPTYFNGKYSLSQVGLTIVPEYRINQVIFVNAGLGFVKDVTSAFVSGYRTGSGISEDIDGWSFKRDEGIGYFVGLGICPNLTDNLALLAEIRFMGSPENITKDFATQLGYKALNINIGLMYKPKQ